MHQEEHHSQHWQHTDHSHTDVEGIQPIFELTGTSENPEHFYHSEDSYQSVQPWDSCKSGKLKLTGIALDKVFKDSNWETSNSIQSKPTTDVVCANPSQRYHGHASYWVFVRTQEINNDVDKEKEIDNSVDFFLGGSFRARDFLDEANVVRHERGDVAKQKNHHDAPEAFERVVRHEDDLGLGL